MCDGEGYYRLGRIPGKGRWQLRATAEGRSLARSSVSSSGSTRVLTLLCETGASLAAADEEGNLALHRAAAGGHT